MTWVKLDDRFHGNRKVRRAWKKCRASIGLYAMGLTYTAQHSRDGHVDDAWVTEQLHGTVKQRALTALIEAGLWTPTEHGYQIHDYLEYNESREATALRRAQDAERKARARRPQRPVSGRTPSERPNAVADVSSPPDPTRPVLTTTALTSPVDEDVDLDESSPIKQVFDAWIKATDRQPTRTKLNPDRRRVIVKALSSHGVEDCLAAVTNIGKDAWARGENDRGTRFDDIKHALGNTERIERWRDWRPGPVKPNADQVSRDRRARRAAALKDLQDRQDQQQIERANR